MALHDTLKKSFKGVRLEADDLYLLESFEIEYLISYLPQEEFYVVLKNHPGIKSFLLKKHPPISDLIKELESEFSSKDNLPQLSDAADKILWTAADMLIYNKCPEFYDGMDFHKWNFKEITDIVSLDNKIVIDAGAGTGRVSFNAAKYAKIVYAVEPVRCLREYIRNKIADKKIENLFVVDGFNHCLPFPDNFTDVIMTSHAIGWDLEKELQEFERVVAPDGYIVHCPATCKSDGDSETHKTLISDKWNYNFAEYSAPDTIKRKYWK